MGDGRHRADPKGHGHYLAAALGVFLLVALLAGGGYTLHGALTTEPSQPATATNEASAAPSPSVFAAASPSGTQRASRGDPPPTLAVTITGENCYVTVTTADGEELIDELLTRDEQFSTNKAPLDVTIGKSGAAEVFVNGERREGRNGGGLDQFEVTRED